MSHFIDTLNRQIANLVAWLATFMVLAITAIVFMRYVFDTGLISLQELVIYAHAVLFLLGSAYTLSENGHVRVDVIYSKLSRKKQAWINLLGTVFLLLPLLFSVIYFSWPFAMDSWAIMEKSAEAGGLPLVFILKSLIPLFAVLLSLQSISQLIKAYRQIFLAEAH
ncbi:TRAP transporter small permease subunit [Gayadomonas joobiniege]|uniref:TRAP transporter small permease subunit n=1 Tax=Gayadomonas joobiniege TaxID=1234606 RepID=UPI0003779764|nr:TRAP transporter small permease subunit [Gayadomonas joobiniege]